MMHKNQTTTYSLAANCCCCWLLCLHCRCYLGRLLLLAWDTGLLVGRCTTLRAPRTYSARQSTPRRWPPFLLRSLAPLPLPGRASGFISYFMQFNSRENGGCDCSENGMGPSMLVCRCWRRCQSWSSWTTTTGNREGRVWLAAGWCCIRLLRLHYTGQVMALNVNGSLSVICPARYFSCNDR